jgi:vacuolar-type H+-ATPase subunit D/Vma8
MSINDIESLAMRLRSLQRRADMFGKTREDLIMEIGDIASDLEKQADRMDREMNDMYLEEQASRYAFQKEYDAS